MSLGAAEIALGALAATAPAWAPALALALIAPAAARRRYGADSWAAAALADPAARIGVFLTLFWALTALLADQMAPFDPLRQFPGMKHAAPGALEPDSARAFLFGGDAQARDVFSRMIHGAPIALSIAPAATGLAILIGVFLGLPAGYLRGPVDAVLSFLANALLAFPVILLLYLLVAPGLREPLALSLLGWRVALSVAEIAGLGLVALGWTALAVFLQASLRGGARLAAQAVLALGAAWLAAGAILDVDPLGWLTRDLSALNIFVAVVFASSPGVFRLTRALARREAARDYVAAARTRGETRWRVMLLEILPNARGPLIVDACLRVGYTTILIGALGFFGLGLAPESPDWGASIREGGQLLRLYIHPALAPALALMSFVLGLNLLADALRRGEAGA